MRVRDWIPYEGWEKDIKMVKKETHSFLQEKIEKDINFSKELIDTMKKGLIYLQNEEEHVLIEIRKFIKARQAYEKKLMKLFGELTNLEWNRGN